MTSPASFATAVQPIVADTLVITPETSLRHGDIGVSTSTGTMPAYFACPEGEGLHPTVLVIHEIFGLHEHIRDVVRRFAKAGYLAVAPELYFRLGRPQDATSIEEIRANFVAKVPDATVLSDLDDSLAWAEAHGGDAARAVVTGFCWGGRISWLYAAHQSKLRAAVAWYGRIDGPTDPLHPRHPIDLAAELKTPVLGLYGAKDAGIPLTDVERLLSALATEGSPSTVHLYSGAPHAFFADYRPSYRAEAAEDGWRRALDWFQRHGA